MSATTGSPTDLVLGRTCELGAVPAPPLHEGRRARIVERWWRDDGLDNVERDAAGNVWGRLAAGDGSAVVVCAHLDTVFDDETPHDIRRDGDRLYGPGVGDDTVAVASLSALAPVLADGDGMPVWALATVGEEGLGNLAGIRAAIDRPPSPIGAVVAVEGNYLGRICTVGVGSRRWRIRFEGPGGHAWERADAPSAVHVAARCVAALDAMARPTGARCGLNVGRIAGGEAINARARTAWFDVDLRCDDPDALETLTEAARHVVDAHRSEGITVHSSDVGDRPAGRVAADHPLVDAAVGACRRAGVEPELSSASTDANAAYAAGLPAITVGVTTGEGEHTPGEYIDVPPLDTGLRILADTIRTYRERGHE